MANTKSAEKNIRKTASRTLRNNSTKSRIRTLQKKVVAAADKGDVAGAKAALSAFSSAADKAAKTKVLHRNNAIRVKNRLAARVAKASAPAAK